MNISSNSFLHSSYLLNKFSTINEYFYSVSSFEYFFINESIISYFLGLSSYDKSLYCYSNLARVNYFFKYSLCSSEEWNDSKKSARNLIWVFEFIFILSSANNLSKSLDYWRSCSYIFFASSPLSPSYLLITFLK